jgi:hypothetical protein
VDLDNCGFLKKNFLEFLKTAEGKIFMEQKDMPFFFLDMTGLVSGDKESPILTKKNIKHLPYMFVCQFEYEFHKVVANKLSSTIGVGSFEAFIRCSAVQEALKDRVPVTLTYLRDLIHPIVRLVGQDELEITIKNTPNLIVSLMDMFDEMQESVSEEVLISSAAKVISIFQGEKDFSVPKVVEQVFEPISLITQAELNKTDDETGYEIHHSNGSGEVYIAKHDLDSSPVEDDLKKLETFL